MDRIQIDYFLAVATHLSFTKASQLCYTSQPNISKHIALLEKELGFALFVRSKQEVALTPAGSVLYEELTSIMGRLDEAIQRAEDISKNSEYTIKIGVSSFLDTSKINLAIKNFQQKYPKSKVFIESEGFKKLKTKAVQEKYDFTISLFVFLSDLDDLYMQPLSKHRMYLACPKSNPLANKPNATVLDFKDETFFILEPSANPKGIDLVFDICNKYGFTPKTQVCNSLESYFIKLELGYGVAFLDSTLRLPERTEDALAYINIPAEIALADLIVMWHKNNNNPAVHLFLEELKIVFEPEQNVIID